jgi:hypothetical protein
MIGAGHLEFEAKKPAMIAHNTPAMSTVSAAGANVDN